jgi:hypothetical protein
MGGVSVIAFVVLLSFAIDRVVTGILFVLSWSGQWRNLCPDPAELEDAHEKVAAVRAEKTAYFVIAGLFSIVVLNLIKEGLFSQLGLQPGRWDMFLSALVLMGGAERVSAFSSVMHPSAAPAAVSEPPLKITGTLMLEEGTIRRLRGEDR